jgi:hypothetical protein
LVWENDANGGGTFHAQLLAENGTPVGSEYSIPNIFFAPLYGVFTGDGFEVAVIQDTKQGAFPAVVQLVHLGLDGTSRSDLVSGPTVSNPIKALAWSGSEIRIMYDEREAPPGDSDGLGNGTFLQRFTAAGAKVGSRSVVTLPSFGNAASSLANGSDTFILESGVRANLMHFDIDGKLVGTALPIVQAASSNQIRMVSQGGDAIVAWLVGAKGYRQKRFELARIRLAE